MKAYNSHDSDTLEDHSKGRLAPGHAAIQQADTRNDEEDKTAHDDLVDLDPNVTVISRSGTGNDKNKSYIFEFPALILLVDVDFLRIAASWDGRAVGRLRWLLGSLSIGKHRLVTLSSPRKMLF